MSLREIELSCPTGRSRVLVGDCLPMLRELADPATCLVVSDSKAREALGSSLAGYRVLEIGEGESAKSLATIEAVYRALLEAEADRGWTLVGAGGGVVCDIAGFAAATYMRGIGCGFVPTTLLAQLDASVGGKNGVNVGGYKNIAGVFRQPDFVLCDPAPLSRLGERDFHAGFSEAVKHAVIASESYFAYLEKEHESALARDRATLANIVRQSVEIKASVVAGDERESGPRAKLNLGHTVGHGLEAILGLRHGEAVSIGMRAACDFSADLGVMSEADAARVAMLLGRLGLPTELDGVAPTGSAQRVIDAIRRDKKRDGDTIKFALPERIGSVRVERVGIERISRLVEGLFA